ncbi:pre-mRNA-splicing factor ATP-dependent RNA helicase PRP1 [Chlorella sorokiniana]|uniref:RNA helicase n=1 Tax=Chlorella sorokiniana TaxID=3076 RepID=A0A2P6TJ67_CHLSO|nr:pre-mRNA-splicing factor ATP-dependent RNA helicase PRP1 [Chlorella sorokiniana]|eukprot:PRW39269.1 pre-mRNA-splicing factor ATP-dependent RNA helicase PRP1 [Chlorella sorokiniana]
MDPAKLPIRQYQQQIVDSVRANAVTVVIGETGSGKTTQISQILEEAGFAEGGMIGVTQPRRVAAVTVARRVAWEKKVELGQEVGYAVRFEDRTCRRTRIKYLTDGTLLRECLDDAQLSQYSVLVLDEAHERSLNTDILFGLLKELVQRREKPLKLVVTSATLDGEKFSKYFMSCPVFHVPGRTFPVDIIHALEDHGQDYLQAAVDTTIDIHCNQSEGDILVFLTGQAEIDKAVKQLNDAVRSLPREACGDLLVLPIYAALPPEMQARVFAPAPSGVRRCIVATNIAETSVTVDGVVYVVDSGVVKQKEYNPRTGMDSLGVTPISRVQATQRAGRAGRTRPGKCFRLYTKKFFEREMPNTTAPEIQRTSLVAAVLYLKSLPLNIDVLGFDYLDAPASESLEDALRQLYVLDAIDVNGGITDKGKAMSLLPLDPSLARALLAARDLKCLEQMMTVASMLSPESSVFMGNKGPEQLAAGTDQQGQQGGRGGGGGPPISEQGRELLKELQKEGLGDHILLLRLYEAWQAAGASIDWCRDLGVDGRSMRFARDIRQQLERIIGPDGSGFESGSGRQRAERQRGSEGGEAGGSREAARRDEQPAAEGRQREGDRERGDRERDGSKRERERERERHSDSRGSKRPRRSGGFCDAATLSSLRMALTIGFANRLARRMPMHNGYRTLGESSTLAQLHPSCARVAADDDGLLPEWMVYHELVSTGRVYLSKVCPVEAQWVQAILPRLEGIDVNRLSGGKTGAKAIAAAEAQAAGLAAAADAEKQRAAAAERRNTDDAVAAARARYLARKAAGGKGR